MWYEFECKQCDERFERKLSRQQLDFFAEGRMYCTKGHVARRKYGLAGFKIN